MATFPWFAKPYRPDGRAPDGGAGGGADQDSDHGDVPSDRHDEARHRGVRGPGHRTSGEQAGSRSETGQARTEQRAQGQLSVRAHTKLESTIKDSRIAILTQAGPTVGARLPGRIPFAHKGILSVNNFVSPSGEIAVQPSPYVGVRFDGSTVAVVSRISSPVGFGHSQGRLSTVDALESVAITASANTPGVRVTR
jgi:hypothetical protein